MSAKPNQLPNEPQANCRDQQATSCSPGGNSVGQPASRLGRRFSTPARLKPLKTTLGDQNRGASRFTRHQSLHLARHSYCDKSFQRRRDHHNSAPGDHKSASPASSSASDSAFSQSQTTLGSEIDQSNCFRRSSLRQGHGRAGDKPTGEGLFRSSLQSSGKDLSSSLAEENDDPNGFKIVWRNLSYRVPEKRFSRAMAWLQRKKYSLWPRADDGLKPAESIIMDAGPCNLNDSPLRAPVAGKPRKVIFSNLNGCVKSGQLTAILGPSGAGKTTFLKCLTSSISEGVSGSIGITGGPATSHHLKLCIIPQKDYLFDNLTVMENLLFASRIKNTQADFKHMDNVERVASLLGLQSCLKLKTSRLSGGQYKRVSIAQELLSKPDILVLDEPTSGLDSLTCFRTVAVLRDLVNLSRTGLMSPLAIIMTIHQPQIKIFNQFHRVYILSSMGHCVYEGRPEYLIDTVAECCKLLPPPDDLNPASFIIDLASEVYGQKPIEQLTKLQRENSSLSLNSEPDNNGYNRANHGDLHLVIDGLQKTPKEPKTIDDFQFEPMKQFDRNVNTNGLKISHRLRKRNCQDHNFWLHTSLLVKRLWISTWRDPLLTTTRITFHLIIPFVFYFVYSRKSGAANACPHVEKEFDFQTITSETSLRRLALQHNELILTFENVSLFFLLLYSFSMCVLAVTALSFPLNMQILLKETGNGWYSMPRFVMAKTLADLPVELTMPTVSVAIAYVLTGQPSSYLCWRMLTVTAVMTLCSLISQTQGLLFGAYFMNNVQAAVFISQASSLPWILLSGFTTRVSELPTVLQWLSFGSIYRLGIESIVAVRYGFGMCSCDEELVNDQPVKMVGIPDQLRSIVRYYIDMYAEQTTQAPLLANNTNSPVANGDENPSKDIFEKIASTLSRANTFGVDIVSCHDVRPFILSAREVDESTLPTFMLILMVILIGLKISLFCVVRLRAG